MTQEIHVYDVSIVISLGFLISNLKDWQKYMLFTRYMGKEYAVICLTENACEWLQTHSNQKAVSVVNGVKKIQKLPE